MRMRRSGRLMDGAGHGTGAELALAFGLDSCLAYLVVLGVDFGAGGAAGVAEGGYGGAGYAHVGVYYQVVLVG